MNFQLSLSSSSPHRCSAVLFPIRKARLGVSASMARLQDSASRAMTMYDVLEVGEKASAKDIKAAYRTQARKWHPDACMLASNKQLFAQRFMMARQAYEVLSDSEQRRRYDLGHLPEERISYHSYDDRSKNWASQLERLQNIRSAGVCRESWGSRMRRNQHCMHPN